MSDESVATVETIANSIVAVRQRRRDGDKTGVAVLWGAGCSRSAKIPLAREIEDRIREKYPGTWKTHPHDYMTLMGALSSQQQRDLLDKDIRGAKLNWCHILLAQLIREDYVHKVFTTNFDPLLVRACALAGGEQPAIYDLASSKIVHTDWISDPAIIYLHGQYRGFVQVHDERDSTTQANDVVRPVFQSCTNYLWIVIGYSGLKDKLFQALQGCHNFQQEVFWLHRRETDVGHVRDFAKSEPVSLVEISGADQFMIEMAARLNQFPPPLVVRPAKHLRDYLEQELGPLPLYEDDGGPAQAGVKSLTDFLAKRAADLGDDAAVAAAVRELVQQLENPSGIPDLAWAAHRIVGSNPEVRDLLAWACVMAGKRSRELAERDLAASKQQHLEEAEEVHAERAYQIRLDLAKRCFEMACDVVPRHPIAVQMLRRITAPAKPRRRRRAD